MSDSHPPTDRNPLAAGLDGEHARPAHPHRTPPHHTATPSQRAHLPRHANPHVQTPRAQTSPALPGRNAARPNPRATHETSTLRPQRLHTNQPSTPSCRSTTPPNTLTTPINPPATPQLLPAHTSRDAAHPPPQLPARTSTTAQPPDSSPSRRGLARRRPPRHQGHDQLARPAQGRLHGHQVSIRLPARPPASSRPRTP